MIELQYQRAIDILDNNKEKLTVLAELLLEKEVIFKDDLVKIFGVRPFEEESTDISEAKEENSKTMVEEEEIKDIKEEK
jgi:cell division protease FtsH